MGEIQPEPKGYIHLLTYIWVHTLWDTSTRLALLDEITRWIPITIQLRTQRSGCSLGTKLLLGFHLTQAFLCRVPYSMYSRPCCLDWQRLLDHLWLQWRWEEGCSPSRSRPKFILLTVPFLAKVLWSRPVVWLGTYIYTLVEDYSRPHLVIMMIS